MTYEGMNKDERLVHLFVMWRHQGIQIQVHLVPSTSPYNGLRILNIYQLKSQIRFLTSEQDDKFDLLL